MADVKISALPAATTPLAGTEVLPIVQSSTTKKVAISDVTAGRAISASSLTLTTTPLAVGSGGTGLNTLTAGYIPYASSSSALSFSSPLYTDGTNVGIGTASPTNTRLAVNSASGPSITVLGAGGYTTSPSGLAFGQYSANVFYIQKPTSATLQFWNSATTSLMELDAVGNLGLGVTPSASWDSAIKAIQINNQGAVWSTSSSNPNVSVSANTRQNGVTYYYLNTAAATLYSQTSGQHQWFTAASGTAGNPITFTQAMTLDASGNLGVGYTSPSTYGTLTVQGSVSSGTATFLSGNSGALCSVNIGRTGREYTLATVGGSNQFFSGTTAGDSVLCYGAGKLWVGTGNIDLPGSTTMILDSSGNVVINTAAIATTATDGFLYVPTCAGTPTGTPTTYTGRAPIVVNTTNNKLYFYSGGAWRDAGP